VKLWEKRFTKRKHNSRLEKFNSSISDDAFLYSAEIKSSLAYVRALFKASILSEDGLKKIKTGLRSVKKRIENGESLYQFEDIHSAVELLLIDEIGITGKKLHTGRSRNEQVVTDEKIYLKTKIPYLIIRLKKIQASTLKLAQNHIDIIMPGYTHLQQAQCILFSHYIMSLFWVIERHISRLYDLLKRIDKLPLGSGALAGSTVALDRAYMSLNLGFSTFTENSIDAVSDRSFILEILFILSILTLDFSRYAEDFIIFSSYEFNFITLSDTISTSSSLMPQKRNPDYLELIRGSAGKISAYYQELFLILKGLPFTYNKDLQGDKIPLYQGIEKTIEIAEVFDIVLNEIQINSYSTKEKISDYLFATDLVDYLTDKSIPFRKAYGIVSEIIAFTEKQKKDLSSLTLVEYRKFNKKINKDVYDIFHPLHSIKKKKTIGSTHPEMVREQIKHAKKIYKKKPPHLNYYTPVTS